MERILFAIKKFIPRRIFALLQPSYHWLLAFSAALFYFFPSRKVKVIGVTGTDGKSTVVSLLHEILRNTGYSVASISSLRFKVNDEEEPNLLKMTMPGRFFVQRFLWRAQKSGAEFAVLEVTSEGVKQFRHRFIKFEAAVLTNLTPEHIEAHGSFENYRAAKGELFRVLAKDGFAVINRDDAAWKYFAAQTQAQKIFYGPEAISEDGTFHRLSAPASDSRISFVIDGVRFTSALFGKFNVLNILAAIAAAHAFDLSFLRISAALKNIPGVPGRLEVIQEKPFRVVVDYAHTPNALRKVYETLRDLQPTTYSLQHKFICVLGAAGGGRDTWKRPELGKIAGEFCGEIILTNEDPYDESPHEIINQIESGLSQTTNYRLQTVNLRKILDRREAIGEALRLARSGDVVIITGKGAEQFMMGPDNTKVPWDDRQAVRKDLERLAISRR